MKMFKWLFIAGIFFLLLAVERVELKKSGVRVSALKQEVSLKEARNQYLRYQISQNSAPERVYKAAEEQLNMRLTPPAEVIVLDD